MDNPFKLVIDNLLDTFSQGNLAPIALKVAAKYNDDAVVSALSPKIDIANTDEQMALFASSDKAFVDSLGLGEDYSAIADEVALNIVEGFNN